MLSTTNLGKSYGDRTLFGGVSIKLSPGARYGLVGANGSGKTTFLKILAGDEPATDGNVSLPPRTKMGVLRQDRFLDDNEIILDAAMMGDKEVWDALHEQHQIIDHGRGDPATLADLDDRIRTHDGYTLEARASAVLDGLGIPVLSHKKPLGTLSGGFKLRVLLAQVLIGGPDVLLLDEPTNHLDIVSIRWLEKFLAAYKGSAIVISHDQRFLDNIATHILDVDYEEITLYPGNFAHFQIEKQAIRERKQAGIVRSEKIIAEKRAFVERFGAKATKAKQAQSRLKQIEKIEVEELADTSRRAPMFKFLPERPSGKDVLDVKEVSKAYGPKHVLRALSLVVRRGEKVAVIGPNGLGKSTLLKIVMGRLTADDGSVRWGHEVHAGYFAQDHHELFEDENTTPLEFLWAAVPTQTTSYVRGQLGRVLFSGDDVQKRVGTLSGGEAARLLFCRIMAQKPNVLVLDEPTNHLDLEAIQALAESLASFDGTVLFVSHDRWFVSQLATRILELTPDGLSDFRGTYSEYLERCGDDHLDADTVLLKTKKERTQGATDTTRWAEQKKLRNRLKDRPARRDRTLAELRNAEARKKELNEMAAADGFLDRTPIEELSKIMIEDEALALQIEAKTAEWQQLEREIAEIYAEYP